MQSHSELIQQTADCFIEESQRWDCSTILEAPAGLWSDTKPSEDTLYIHERSGQIVVLERGVVSVQWANRELKKYQKNLRQGLIQELVYLRRTGTD